MSLQTGSLDLKSAKAAYEVANGKASQEDLAIVNTAVAAAQDTIDDIDTLINGGYVLEITSPYDNSELSYNKSQFYEAVEGVYGVYTFGYDGADWRYNGSVIDLADYGLKVITAMPESGDEISINLVNVGGAINDLTQSISEISSTVDANENKAASDLESAQAELMAAIEGQSAALSEAQASIRTISTKTASMGYSDDYGLVLYGKDADASTGYKLQLAAGAINFINGALGNAADIKATLAADINTGQVFMIINDAIINNQLKFGNFAFIPRSNGNMALKYIG